MSNKISNSDSNASNAMYPKIRKFIEQLDLESIDSERYEDLNVIRKIVHRGGTNPLRFNFICTHNSRRSQFSQALATIVSKYYKIEIESFSGGVEVTACYQQVLKTLTDIGFQLNDKEQEEQINPIHSLAYSNNQRIRLFSKLHDDPSNPASDFYAIMTCAHADENCPFIPGALKRLPLRYIDPKKDDGTDREAESYMKCCVTIATEMKYIFSPNKNLC